MTGPESEAILPDALNDSIYHRYSDPLFDEGYLPRLPTEVEINITRLHARILGHFPNRSLVDADLRNKLAKIGTPKALILAEQIPNKPCREIREIHDNQAAAVLDRLARILPVGEEVMQLQRHAKD